MTRQMYDHELLELRDGVVQLSLMVDRAVAKSTESLIRHDVELAQQVIGDDDQINEMRWKLEDDALTLIATQAPMARDLRAIAAGLHILTDLERMGDHAAGNAKITKLIADEAPLKPFVDIPTDERQSPAYAGGQHQRVHPPGCCIRAGNRYTG